MGTLSADGRADGDIYRKRVPNLYLHHKKTLHGKEPNKSPKPVALETFTLGVGGRKGELIGKSS